MNTGWIEIWNARADLLGGALLRACWQGGLAVVLVWLVCRALPRLSPALRCGLWRLAYLKLVISFLWATPVSLPLLTPLPASHVPASTVPAAEAPPASAYGASSAAGEVDRGPIPITTAPSTLAVKELSPSLSPVSALPFLLLLAWGVGIAWRLVRIAGEWCAAEWLRGLSEPLRDEALIACSVELSERLGLKETPRLMTCEGAGSPVLLGVVGPVVILPARLLTECAFSEIQLVLAHELSHRRRGDLVWGWLPAVAHALFFFYPLEWLANREYRLSQEMACDALAVAASQAPAVQYGEMLVKVASGHRPNLQSRLVTVGIIESSDALKRRLIAMKAIGPWNARHSSRATSALIMAGLAGCIPWKLTERPALAAPGGGEAHTVGSGTARAGGQASRPELRYHPKKGETFVYNVKIESDEPDYTETMAGNVSYNVPESDQDGVTLNSHGNLMPIRRSKTGQFLPGGMLRLHEFGFGGFGSHFGPFASPNEVKVDSLGRVLSSRGGTPLPRALGDLTQLVVETLASEGKLWQANTNTAIVLKEIQRLTPHSLLGRASERTLPAEEQIHYALEEMTGNTARIKKHYELKTLETVGGDPRISMVGDGEITFDIEAGMPRAEEFKVTLTERQDANTTIRIPVTLTYHLLEGADREKALQPPVAAPVPGRKALTDAEIDRALADLRTGDQFKVMGAAGQLSLASPDRRRTEVARALEAQLGNKDSFARVNAIKALAVWGDRDSVPLVIKRLDDDAFNVRWAALETLGALKDGRAAAPVAKRLKDDHAFAANALKAMGPVAAPAVAPYLQDADWSVRLEACHILKEIGTEPELPALQRATQDENGLVKGAAEEAIKAINAHGGKNFRATSA